MNIALQYVTKIARIATNICPNAQPIDSTIGVEALDISLITQVRLNNEALQNPLNPALKKKTPIEKIVIFPATILKYMPPVIIIID